MRIKSSPQFRSEAKQLTKKYPSLADEIAQLYKELHNNPRMGEPLGLDCFKIRLAVASKGGGKSGGTRVITCVRIVKDQIDLLSIYDKSERSTYKKHELVALIKRHVE